MTIELRIWITKTPFCFYSLYKWRLSINHNFAVLKTIPLHLNIYSNTYESITIKRMALSWYKKTVINLHSFLWNVLSCIIANCIGFLKDSQWYRIRQAIQRWHRYKIFNKGLKLGWKPLQNPILWRNLFWFGSNYFVLPYWYSWPFYNLMTIKAIKILLLWRIKDFKTKMKTFTWHFLFVFTAIGEKFSKILLGVANNQDFIIWT